MNDILENGVTETDEKTKEKLLGIKDLKKKYFDVWYEPDNASGMNYEEKIQVFNAKLLEEMEPVILGGGMNASFLANKTVVYNNIPI